MIPRPRLRSLHFLWNCCSGQERDTLGPVGPLWLGNYQVENKLFFRKPTFRAGWSLFYPQPFVRDGSECRHGTAKPIYVLKRVLLSDK